MNTVHILNTQFMYVFRMIPTINEYLLNNPQRLIFVSETQCVSSIRYFKYYWATLYGSNTQYKPQGMIRTVEHTCPWQACLACVGTYLQQLRLILGRDFGCECRPVTWIHVTFARSRWRHTCHPTSASKRTHMMDRKKWCGNSARLSPTMKWNTEET